MATARNFAEASKLVTYPLIQIVVVVVRKTASSEKSVQGAKKDGSREVLNRGLWWGWGRNNFWKDLLHRQYVQCVQG